MMAARIIDRRIGETLERHLARLIALHGLGTINGADRWNPPTPEWTEDEWRKRILTCIPSVAQDQCIELARAVMALTGVEE